MRECVKDKVLIDGQWVECFIEKRMWFDDKGHMQYTEAVLKRCDE